MMSLMLLLTTTALAMTGLISGGAKVIELLGDSVIEVIHILNRDRTDLDVGIDIEIHVDDIRLGGPEDSSLLSNSAPRAGPRPFRPPGASDGSGRADAPHRAA